MRRLCRSSGSTLPQLLNHALTSSSAACHSGEPGAGAGQIHNQLPAAASDRGAQHSGLSFATWVVALLLYVVGGDLLSADDFLSETKQDFPLTERLPANAAMKTALAYDLSRYSAFALSRSSRPHCSRA